MRPVSSRRLRSDRATHRENLFAAGRQTPRVRVPRRAGGVPQKTVALQAQEEVRDLTRGACTPATSETSRLPRALTSLCCLTDTRETASLLHELRLIIPDLTMLMQAFH